MTDIVERIRNASLTPMGIAADEIEQLRKDKAELLEALTDLWAVSHWADNPYEMDAAKLAIAKATGEE